MEKTIKLNDKEKKFKLFCEVCGYKGKVNLKIALAHKMGFHNGK